MIEFGARVMYSEVGFAQYMRLLELDRKAKEEEKGVRVRINSMRLSAKEIRERITALNKHIEREQEENEDRYGKDKGQ